MSRTDKTTPIKVVKPRNEQCGTQLDVKALALDLLFKCGRRLWLRHGSRILITY